jgi:SAM-dependent methyltransferase
MNKASLDWRRLYAGVGLTTLATLLLELALTRIFSVVFYYHFAFLAISIALFGLGAGGVFSYVVAGWKRPFFAKLGLIAAVNAVLVLAALVFVLTLRGELGYGTLAMVYFMSALPFFAAGTTISLVIAETIERVDRVYFADLLGAAAGCLILIPLLDTLGGPDTVIAAALLYAVSAENWFQLAKNRRSRGWAAALAGAMLLLLGVNAFFPLIDVRYAKGKELAQERFVRWNSFSRVALSAERGTGMPNIVIDADAATGIPRFDFAKLSSEDRRDLLYQGPGLVYTLRPGAKALVIGAGGGWDLARALASGSRDITAVEINPIIATTIMRERFPDLSRRLYFRPEVRVRVEDGRSFVRRTREKYGVIQMTLVDTWASTAAGAFALSENNLYTSDAFYEYLNHLTPDGILVFTRWGLEPPRESLRLISLARTALARLGETDLARHIMVVREGSATDLARWGATDTVLISRSAFGDSDVARLRADMQYGRFRPLYLPDETVPNAFTSLIRSRDPSAFERGYRYDVSSVDDNRPFFFYTVQPRDVWSFIEHASRLSADYNVNRAVPLIFGLFIVSLLATGIMLMLPRLLLGSRLPSDKGTLRFLWYFIFIGAGYILIQVALVQKFVLFLGHPTYALTVIIFSMLMSSGLGSYFSQRIAASSDGRLGRVLALVAVLVAVLAVSVSPLLGAGVGLPLPVKFVISVLLIAPPGFLMGVPFPTGLRRLEDLHKPSVRWAWSLNAAASVLGSVAAIVLAIYLGLRETLLTGGAMYLCALATLRVSRRAIPRERAAELAPAAADAGPT